MSDQYCFWVLSKNIDFCTFIPQLSPSSKVFGFAEFLTSLALLAIIFTTADVRYKFRIATAALPIRAITYIFLAIIGLCTLVTDVWLAEKLPLIDVPYASVSVWQGLLGLILLLIFLIWIWYAFIKPPIFNACNAKNFYEQIYFAILRGDRDELKIVADELGRSARKIVSASYTNSELTRLQDAGSRVDGFKGRAFEILLLIANTKFCQSIVGGASVTAIIFLNEVVAQNRFDIPIGRFVVKLSTEALTNDDSLLHDEARGQFEEGLIGATKPLSNSLFGNYELIKGLGNTFCSPLDVDFSSRFSWDAKNWNAYFQALLISFEVYLEKTNGGEKSPAIYRAFTRAKDSISQLYVLDGAITDLYGSDEYRKLESFIDFIGELVKLLDKNQSYLSIRSRDKNVRNEYDAYDLVADLMYQAVLGGSQIKSPQWSTWTIQHNIIWGRFFGLLSQSPSSIILQKRLVRLIYKEINTIQKTPHAMNMRLLGYCLNVMGLIYKKSKDNKDVAALQKITIKTAKKFFRGIYQFDPDLAECALIGSISYDSSTKSLIKTYRKGLGQNTASTQILVVD